ncbi:MAG: hypothetical protein JWM62_354 [Frankiales bacterium]|jgi:Tfp pilus assembly protein PilO|nr:hypothetical protein [Frankiales bacterium]
MDKLKQWVALTLLGCLGIMVAGWFLLVAPKRGEAAEVRAQADAQESTNAGLRTQLEVLKAQAKDLPKKQADLARVAAKIPDNPGLPALIRALTAASASAGVQLTSVTPGTPSAVVSTALTAPAATPAQPAAAGATTTSSSGLAGIPLTLSITGGYFETSQFLANLENLPRALRVTNLAVAPGSASTGGAAATASDGRSVTSTITGAVYMASARPAAAPVSIPSTTDGAAS